MPHGVVEARLCGQCFSHRDTRFSVKEHFGMVCLDLILWLCGRSISHLFSPFLTGTCKRTSMSNQNFKPGYASSALIFWFLLSVYHSTDHSESALNIVQVACI